MKGRSFTVFGVVSSFCVVLIFMASSRQLHQFRIANARREHGGRPQVVTLFEPIEGTVSEEKHASDVQNETAIVERPSYTCNTNTSSDFDSAGNPCFDLNNAATYQNIYAVNTKDVSYVYCSIPKNGCTYHLGIMHRLLGFDYEGGGEVHLTPNKDRLRVSPKMLQGMLLDPKVEKYMVVRNPLERVLSAYLDKVERMLPASNKTPQAFKEWVYEELTPGMHKNSSANVHWKSQMTFCGFTMRDLWKRFRWFTVEDPVEYIDYLEELLPEWVTKDGWNGTANASLRESVLGPRKRTGNTSEKFFRYVPTLKLFDYLVEVYRVDIEGLGYQKEIKNMRKELLKRIKDPRNGTEIAVA